MSAQKYSSLSQSSQVEFESRYNLKIVDPSKIGKIQGVDVFADVNKGFDKGDQLGANIGSLLYLESRNNFFDYSASNHFATMIVGGIIASNILNRPDEKYRVIKYGINRLDGEFVYIDVISYTNFSHAAGACIFLDNLMLINADACSK